MEKEVKIKNGIDPRGIASLVQTCSAFRAEIKIQYGTKIANAKSIMGVISLGIVDETNITLIAKGEDEEDAVDKVSEFLEAL